MAFLDRTPSNSPIASGSGRTKELFAAVLLATLMAALALRWVLSLDALAPAMATLTFAMAAAAAGIALLCRCDGLRATWFDIAGMLTLVGIGITILIEPDQMVRLVTLSEQSD